MSVGLFTLAVKGVVRVFFFFLSSTVQYRLAAIYCMMIHVQCVTRRMAECIDKISLELYFFANINHGVFHLA